MIFGDLIQAHPGHIAATDGSSFMPIIFYINLYDTNKKLIFKTTHFKIFHTFSSNE